MHMDKVKLESRLNELAEKLIKGTSTAMEDIEFKELYVIFKEIKNEQKMPLINL